MGDWPARLLHIPSMTSLPWQPGNVYGTQHEPRYATISYTWGRWRLSSDNKSDEASPISSSSHPPSLKVSGISWRIPPIDAALFTVQQFERVLREISSKAKCEYVWVDVACIDQSEGSEQGKLEIGRQAKIFGKSYRTFIWLPSMGVGDDPPLQDLFWALEEAVDTILTSHRNNSRHMRCKAEGVSGEGTFDTGSSEEDMDRFDPVKCLVDASAAIAQLTSLPWFSSLWTLQEAFLQPSAMFLNMDADTLTATIIKPDDSDADFGSPTALILEDLLRVCKMFHRLCSVGDDIASAPEFSRKPDGRDDTSWALSFHRKGLIRILERAGLVALAERDRMALYSCAKARTTTNPLDRIYGIMQIWGYRLGESAQASRPSRTGLEEEPVITVRQLEIELATHLVSDFPIESQLQVQGGLVPGRQAWRISDLSVIPAHDLVLRDDGWLAGVVDRKSSQLGCRRANNVEYGYFEGYSCEYDGLLAAWKYLVTSTTTGAESTPVLYIALDHTRVLNSTTLGMYYPLSQVPRGEHLRLAERISAVLGPLGRRVLVLLLGIVDQTQVDGAARPVQTAIGIIVMDAPDAVIGGWWKRLGICLWTVPSHQSDYFPAREDVEASTSDVYASLSGLREGSWEYQCGIFG